MEKDLFSFHFFVSFMEKRPPTKLMIFFTIFQEFVKLQSFEWLNCILISWARMEMQNMLIVAYMKSFEIFC